MILKTFLIESRRSFKLVFTLFLCSFLFGFAAFSSFELKNYIEKLFSPTEWGIDLAILPKGTSPESLKRSLLTGRPEGLIPVALFKTLQAQITDEQRKSSLTQPTFKALGFLPYQKNGSTQIAILGNPEDFFVKDDRSIWSSIKLTDWNQQIDDLSNLPNYKTPEWGSQVLMGILIKGESEPLLKLKEMINRRTVAQAWVMKAGISTDDQKINQLETALYTFTCLIFLCLVPGLILSFIILSARRNEIFIVLKEIGWKQASQLQFILLQIVILFLIPCTLGVFTSPLILNWVNYLFILG